MLVVQTVASVPLAHRALGHRAIALDPTPLALSTCPGLVGLPAVVRRCWGWRKRLRTIHLLCLQQAYGWPTAFAIQKPDWKRSGETISKHVRRAGRGPTDPKRREEEVLGTLLLICGVVHMPRLGPSCLVLFLPRMLLLHPYIHLAGNVVTDEHTNRGAGQPVYSGYLWYALKDCCDIILYR
jgi:hypothetical protein